MALWQFFIQSPMALLATLGIAVPIAIHLLSKNKGKLVLFGSIELIKQLKPVRMTQIRLVERLLLFCRMMVLVLSALIIAQLFLLNENEENIETVLVTPAWLNNATIENKEELIKRLKNTEVILLNAKSIGNKQILSADNISSWRQNESISSQTYNTWLMINEYLKSTSTTSSVSVYATNSANQFGGDQIAIEQKIDWHIIKIVNENLDTLANPIMISVYFDNELSLEFIYLKKALQLLKEKKLSGLVVTYVNLSLPDKEQAREKQVDWIINLTDKPLSFEAEKSTNILNFNDGSIRDWSQLAQQPQFPQVLLNFLLREQLSNELIQQSRLTEQQISNVLPIAKSESSVGINRPILGDSLERILAILLVLFWCLERLLSEYSIRVKSTSNKGVETA